MSSELYRDRSPSRSQARAGISLSAGTELARNAVPVVMSRSLRYPVHVGKHRLGKLSAEDGGRLRQDLEAARERDRAVCMSGRYFAAAAASPDRLLLYPGSRPFP